MPTHANRVKMTVSGTPGTGTITLGSASSGFQSFSTAYGGNATVDVLITDGTAWEVARDCTYTHSGTTLSRGTLEDSSTGSAISLTSSAVVSVILSAERANQFDMFALGLGQAEVSVTTTATLTIGRMHVCSGTSADYTVTLPAASGNTGKLIGIRMSTALTKLVTVDGNASETIDGATTRVMWAGESAILLCDETGWTKIAGKTIPMCGSATGNTGVSLSSSTHTKIGLVTSVIDNTGMMVDVSTNDRITVKRAGEYEVLWAPGISNTLSLGSMFGHLYKNGASIASTYAQYSTGGYPTTNGSLRATFAVADYLEVYVIHYDGSTEPGGNNARLQVTEIPTW